MAPQSDRNRGENATVSKALTIDDLRSFFHLPIVEVAKQLGTCTTALKKICRKNKIMKWPYRQIRSITKSIQSLEMASLNDTLPDDLKYQYREQVFELQKAIDEIVQDPNTDVSMHLKENFEMEGGDEFDENDNDGEGSSRRYSGPSTSVMQIMQAAAATAGFETSSVKSSSNTANSKRKREEDSLKALQEGDLTPEVQAPTIGLTTVGLVANADAYRNVFFVGPVQLAPLQRKKIKSTKKLVPLIEPDICNHYKMEFLPNSILHHSDKYVNKSLESAIIAGYPPQNVASVTSGTNSNDLSALGNNTTSDASATVGVAREEQQYPQHQTQQQQQSLQQQSQQQQNQQRQSNEQQPQQTQHQQSQPQLQQSVPQQHERQQPQQSQPLQPPQQYQSSDHSSGYSNSQQSQEHDQSVAVQPYADYNAYTSAVDSNTNSYGSYQNQAPSSYGGVKN
jgi:hypothetical protein